MKYIFANWKMYLDYDESVKLAEVLSNIEKKDNIEFGVFPSSLAMKSVVDILKDSNFVVGAQDSGFPSKGAYTGLVSAHMFKDVGCTHTLVGHSERRHIFGDNNEVVRKKLEASIDAGLIPVLCIGETKEDRENNKIEYRIKKQIMKAFSGLDFNNIGVIIAYEPVWAIGSGDFCLPEEAEKMIKLIKQEIKQYTDQNVAVLYGGSVSADNVLSYLSISNIDGVLVGGTSTKSDTFIELINKAVSI